MSVQDKPSAHAVTWKASNTNAIPVHELWECTLRQLGSKLKENRREGAQFLSYRPDFYFQLEERVKGCEGDVISHKVVIPDVRSSEAQEVPAEKPKTLRAISFLDEIIQLGDELLVDGSTMIEDLHSAAYMDEQLLKLETMRFLLVRGSSLVSKPEIEVEKPWWRLEVALIDLKNMLKSILGPQVQRRSVYADWSEPWRREIFEDIDLKVIFVESCLQSWLGSANSTQLDRYDTQKEVLLNIHRIDPQQYSASGDDERDPEKPFSGDLKGVIMTTLQATNTRVQEDLDRAAPLNTSRREPEDRYNRAGDMADLGEAIKTARQAVDATPKDHPDRATCLHNLGLRLGDRYNRTGSMADLEEAIETARQTIKTTPQDHPDRAGYLNNLGVRLGDRYSRTGGMPDLAEAIDTTRQAINTTPQDNPNRVGYLNNLGNRLGDRYSKTGAIDHLEEALEAARLAIGATQQDHPNRAACLNNLGLQLGDRYSRTGSMADLEEAIGKTRLAIGATPEGHHDRAGYLNNLGNWLGSRFERSGEIRDLEEAIDISRRAVQSTPPDHPYLAASLHNLGSWLGSRFERTGEMKDLEEAIDTARQAMQSTPSAHPTLAIYLNNLASFLGHRFERSGEMKDLQEAIDRARQAVQSTPPDHPNLALYLNSLSSRLGRLFERTGEVKDLEGAIDTARQAVNLTPSDHPDLAGRLNNLGSWLERWFERRGEMKDLENAIDTGRQAVQSTPPDHPNLAMYLNNLGSWLGRRFEHTGEMKDLEEAIDTVRQAVQSTPRDHPNLAAISNNLGSWLGRRFERSGEMEDLGEAISTVRQAVQLTPSDHPNLVMYLNNLGNRLWSRFERSGELNDLEEAINTGRQAVQSTPPDHPNLAMYLNNLGSWLGRRFEHTGEMKDLEEAIDTVRQAVQSTPRDHPNLAAISNNLGSWLGSRFERTGEMKDLEEAIDTARQAMQSTPPDHPNLALYLNNLASFLGHRFEHTGEVNDLEKAIDTGRQAVQLTPHDHPNLAVILNNLGSFLDNQFERSGKKKDLEHVVQCYLGAFDCTTAVPLERVKAAARCLSKLADQREIRKAVMLGRDALTLLPIVSNRNLDRNDQQYALSGFSGIAADLCALLLSEGCVHEAVECLEQGRATIISRLLDDRSDISGLCQEHPKLAEHYQSLVAEVNTPFGSTEDNITAHAKATRRREAVTALEACVIDIRAISGYERFLLRQTVAEMQEGINEGYVAIVNISQIRSDAVIMTRGSLQAISLPELIVNDARRWLGTDWIVRRRSEQRQKNDMFLRYLAWLWHVCVEDTLDRVSVLYRGQGSGLPRVWWIGCGLASSMPFHAAGVHAHGSLKNALSRVTSSYTPSVKALGYSRSQTKHARSDQPARDQMLITLMPQTPKGANDKGSLGALKGVSNEKEKILSIVSPYVSPIVRETPDAGVVLSELEKCQIAHFACHGMSDLDDPSSSGLVLQRLAPDGTLEQDHLSVSRIAHLRLKHAQIAYLSACSTAENKGARLRDEVIHIVSGFQVAGFPHVIGSLWPAGDDECVQVAGGFYTSLFEHKGVPDSGAGRVAWALREAVMAARAEDMDMPLNWAQFVHFGA